MSQIRTRDEKMCSGQKILDGQMDEGTKMDGQTDHKKLPVEWGPNQYVVIEKEEWPQEGTNSGPFSLNYYS